MRRHNWAACDVRYKKRIGDVDRKSITNLLLNYKTIFLFTATQNTAVYSNITTLKHNCPENGAELMNA
jgi:hypothetical protein